MLLPLALALFIRARYEEVASGLLPLMAKGCQPFSACPFCGFLCGLFIGGELGKRGEES
jgi:hypothetical protein